MRKPDLAGIAVRPGPRSESPPTGQGAPADNAHVVEALNALLSLPAAVAQLQVEVAHLRAEVRALQAGDPEQMLTTEDAAKLMGMTTGALHAAAARGRFPAKRIGRRLRFRRGDLLSSGRIHVR